ncbi:hypothetical protein K493DRAFT_364933, partial [Basidiobolus meristosporus CBS 931.73]
VDQLLANNLKTKNIQGFKKNLSALAVLDRFANNCPQVDFPHCISSIYKDMKSIFAQEMSSSSNDIEAVLLIKEAILACNPENASRDTIKKALDASFKWRVQMEDSKLRQRYSYVSQLSEGLILRHHIVFNSLLQSCFNASSYSIEQENEEITLEALIQNDIDHPLMQIEISTPNPPYSIIASFAEPFTHSIVTLEINIEKHSAQPLVKRYSAMNAMEADTDVYNEEKMTKVLRTCGSIPIMVEWLFKS